MCFPLAPPIMSIIVKTHQQVSHTSGPLQLQLLWLYSFFLKKKNPKNSESHCRLRQKAEAHWLKVTFVESIYVSIQRHRNQCQYKNRWGNLIPIQSWQSKAARSTGTSCSFSVFILMYVQMVESQQFGTCMTQTRWECICWMKRWWYESSRPSLWWYKVARCCYQLHVHLKRWGLASCVPWTADNSRNPSEGFKEPSIISQTSEFLEKLYPEPRTFLQMWSQSCRLHWIHIIYSHYEQPQQM